MDELSVVFELRGGDERGEGFEVFVECGGEGGNGEVREEVLLCVKGFVGRGRGRGGSV